MFNSSVSCYWSFILYPESVPDYWRSYLDDLHIPWIESPLHDKDTYAYRQAKKPHIHILLLFSHNVTYDFVISKVNKLNGVCLFRVVDALSIVRYFVHLDNPEKCQYNVDDIVFHGDFSTDLFLMRLKNGR